MSEEKETSTTPALTVFQQHEIALMYAEDALKSAMFPIDCSLFDATPFASVSVDVLKGTLTKMMQELVAFDTALTDIVPGWEASLASLAV